MAYRAKPRAIALTAKVIIVHIDICYPWLMVSGFVVSFSFSLFCCL